MNNEKKINWKKTFSGAAIGVAGVTALPVAGPIGAVTGVGALVASGIGALAAQGFDWSKVKNHKAIVSVASYLAHLNNIKDEERYLLQKFIAKAPKEKLESLQEIIDNPPSFETLTKRLKSAANEDSDKEQIRKIINNIIHADGEISQEEEIAAFKIEFFLANKNQLDIFKIVKSSRSKPRGEISNIITFLGVNEAPKKYKFPEGPKIGQIYFPYHADDSVLVSTQYLQENCLKDQENEIIKACVLSGAKEIAIKRYESEDTKKSFSLSSKLTAPIKGFKTSSSGKIKNSSWSEKETSQNEYRKYGKPRVKKFDELKENLDNFINESFYLKSNKKFMNEIEARFGQTQSSSFEIEIEEKSIHKQVNKINAAASANGLEEISIDFDISQGSNETVKKIHKYNFKVTFHMEEE